MNPANFLDLWDILVNELVGSKWLFVFIGLAVIWFVAIKNKMTTEAAILICIIFIAAVFSQTNYLILWAALGLGVGFIFYYRYQKIIRQG